jgi:hypothetical protein
MADSRRRKTPRDIVRSMLTSWGEYEALGLYSARAQRSMLGRMGDSRPTGDGRPLPPVWIPGDVQLMCRLVALMRETSRAGEVYYRLLRKRYVAQEDVSGRQINRAEHAVTLLWMKSRLRKIDNED